MDDKPSVEERIEGTLGRLMGDQEEEVVDQAEDAADQVDESEDSEAVEQQTEAVDEVEVEVEGWKAKVPSKVKDALEKAADYTRKTQEVADQRRLMDAQNRLSQEQQAFYQAAKQEFDQFQQIEAQLEQYRKVDLSQVDSETLSRMSMAAANLREERAKLKEALESKKGEFKQKMVSAWDDMASKAHEAVTRSVPDWDKSAASVAEWAIREGFPFELITGHDRSTRERVGPGVVDPTFAKTLYKAWKWDQLQSNKASTTTKTSKAAPFVKPGSADAKSSAQITELNFRKAMKQAKSPNEKAALIGEKLARKFNF